MPLIQNTSVTQAPPPPPPPAKIHASASAWNLQAAPATIQDAAGQLRARAMRAVAAQLTVNDSATSLVANDYWSGDSADLYQGHREKVTGDLGALATHLGTTADTLDSIAAILVYGQGALDGAWDTVKDIPHPRSGHDIVFAPRNETEAVAVHNAMTAADEIRAGIDEALVLSESALTTARDDLTAIADTWQPRSIRLLDLNIGQGYGNVPFDSSGTDHGDMDEIGQTIVDSGANVVTLQEVFKGDLGKLEDWLNENGGGGWEVHFAAATHKYQFDDAVGGSIWNLGSPSDWQPFGNAILVHTGGDIATSDELEELTLHDPGNTGAINPWGQEGRSMEGAHIEFENG